jgi:outer membrane protein TolC
MRLRFLPGVLAWSFAFPVVAQQQLTVQDAIVAALQQNYDVRLMQNSAASAFSDERYSIGLFLPVITADGAYTKIENNTREVTADERETVRRGLQSTTMNGAGRLSWTLFDGTRMFATRKRLDLTASQSSIDV